MKYVEEAYAKNLHHTLSGEFARTSTFPQVSVEGRGVHWSCIAQLGERSCSIDCFDNHGPEYLVSFRRDTQVEAWGRTGWKPEIVEAVSAWLGGDEIDDLHDRFAFVDRQKRALSIIEAEAVRCCQELRELASSEIRHFSPDLHELWFNAKDRSCRISCSGKNENAVACFHWDECELFRIRTADAVRLAAMLGRWLCARAMPSEMSAEFPDAEIGPIARYYEEGRPVEGEFIMSWDYIERSGSYKGHPCEVQVLDMIARIRQAGYDRTLRAGTSLWSLVVSRSRRHGLRRGQPSIVFGFSEKGVKVYCYIDGEERLTLPRIEFSPQVDGLLKRLVHKDID
jgi:hypothetical protein